MPSRQRAAPAPWPELAGGRRGILRPGDFQRGGSRNWVTLTNAPTLVGNTTWQVTVPATGGPQFFRLWG